MCVCACVRESCTCGRRTSLNDRRSSAEGWVVTVQVETETSTKHEHAHAHAAVPVARGGCSVVGRVSLFCGMQCNADAVCKRHSHHSHHSLESLQVAASAGR